MIFRLADHGLQIVRHGIAGGVAFARIARQRLQNDQIQRRGHLGTKRRRRRDRLFQNAAQLLDRRRAVEQSPARQHLPQHRPQREQIHPAVLRLVTQALGCHVAESSLERVSLAHLRIHLADGLRDPEIQQLHAASPQAHDVRGTDVAMDDVEGLAIGRGQRVRVSQTQRHLVGDVSGDRDRKLLLTLTQRAEDRQKIAPAQELHRQEVTAIHLSKIEDLNDVRVVQKRGDACFVHEHLDEARGPGPVRQDALDDQIASEPFRARHHGAEYLGHTAHSHPVEEDIPSESLRCVRRVHEPAREDHRRRRPGN